MASPLCTHFGLCGGCDWQHLTYDAQLARKQRRLGDLFQAALGARAPRVQPIIGMPVDDSGWPWHFRHKASFVFDSAEGQPLVIGHYAANSNTVVPIVECPVHATRANRIAFALHAELARARIPVAGPSLRGVLRHLIVRTTRDERDAMAMLVVTRNDKALRTPIRRFLDGPERPDGFLVNIHDKPGPYMVGRDTIRIDGQSHVRERLDVISFLVSPTAFFQTNVSAARMMLDYVLALAPSTPQLRVLDLYSGSGLFTLPLASRGHRVTSVEESSEAVADAEANITLNRLSGVRVLRARVEEAMRRLSREAFDLAILDPPRQGCPPSVIEALFGEIAPTRVVYVSCNPEALASELAGVLRRGYVVDQVQPVDMFPHTTHIETIVTLHRR